MGVSGLKGKKLFGTDDADGHGKTGGQMTDDSKNKRRLLSYISSEIGYSISEDRLPPGGGERRVKRQRTA